MRTLQLTRPALDQLLSWLDSDPRRAGEGYERIRRRLGHLFACRGCTCPEELVDETLDRVMARLPDFRDHYVGDPVLYFYGVARNVYHEYSRRRSVDLTAVASAPQPSDESEAAYQCLERCMDRLPEAERNLILCYHRSEKRSKIDERRQLAQNLGIGANALRIRTHRIRLELQRCLEACLRSGGDGRNTSDRTT